MADLKVFVNRWMIGVAIASTTLILIGTLCPFDFSAEVHLSAREIFNTFFEYRGNFKDWIPNVVLYIPLGFGLAGLLQKTPNRKAQFAVISICAIASIATETLQLFLPSRHPSFSDIFTNCIGGLLGFQSFLRWRYSITRSILTFVEKIRTYASIWNLTFLFIGYTALILIVSTSLQSKTDLNNWSQIYPLLLGNERTETVSLPWQGRISELSIADRAISEQEVVQAFSTKSLFDTLGSSLVAAYQLTDQENYSDLTGHLPKLVWQGEFKDSRNRLYNSVTNGYWLATEQPASLLTQRLRKTSQFTLSVVAAAMSTTQTGLAQIVSFSGDLDNRNFSLGQQETHLVFRLRTSATGVSGTRPELIIPDVFSDISFHHIIVVYDNPVLRFYIDQPQNSYSFELNPGVVLFQKLLPLDKLGNLGLLVCKVLYYGFVFVPIGFLVGFVVVILKAKPLVYFLLIFEGIVLVPLLLEVLLSISNERNLNLENFLLSITLAASAMIFVIFPYLKKTTKYINGIEILREEN